MKRVLTAPVQIWHLVLAAVLVSALTGTAVVSAASPSSFLGAGSIRMSVAQVNPGPTIPNTASNVVVLKQTITIPAGKVADVVAFGEVDIQNITSTGGYEYCFGQYRLDNSTTGKLFKPGNYILYGFTPQIANNLSVPINGYMLSVPAGTHTVYLEMGANYHDCIINMGSMILFANVR